MKKIEHVFHYDAIKGNDNKVYIDADFIKLLLEFYTSNQDEKKEPVIEKVEIKKEVDIKKELSDIIRNSVVKGPQPWKRDNIVIGEAPYMDICFNKERLEQYRGQVTDILNRLKEINTLDDLAILKDGTEWTKLRQQMKFLMTVANALGLIDFDFTLEERQNADMNNPRLVRKTKKELI